MLTKHSLSLAGRSVLILFLLVGELGIAPVQPVLAATRLYVKSDAAGANDGTSWGDAFTDLQSALAAATGGDEIWVAAGTYSPTTGTDRMISFALHDGVAIYGGFAGTETLSTQRNPTTNVTILSGDLGTPTDNTDNSYHVVTGSNLTNAAVLDGFTIMAGNANQNQLDSGGGLLNHDGSPTIANVIFSQNAASLGAGMYSSGSLGNPNPTISRPVLSKVKFVGNSALEGGGMENQSYSSPILTDVVFSNNTATRSGGGMLNYDNSSPSVTNATFSGNMASAGGGITNSNYSSPILQNVTFHANSATESGGGIDNESASGATLLNVTFTQNVAIEGGGIYIPMGNGIHAINIILHGDTGGEIYDPTGAADVMYSIVQDGFAGTGNLNTNPLLGSLQDNGGFTQTMAVSSGSPAINTGTNLNCPATDQRGVTRPQGGQCDIGAYEYQDTTAPTVTSIVRANPNPTTPGSVDFTVSFSETVVNVGTSDFELATTGVTGALITGVSGSGAGYTVTVNTGSGGGTVRLDVPVTASIQDTFGNALTGLPFTSGEEYTVNEMFALNVGLSGNGSGTVTAPGINCPGDCSQSYVSGTVVTLAPTPATGSSFAAWSGDADCSDGQVTMDAARTCTATLTLDQHTLTVNKAGTGSGTVTSTPDGINCGLDCLEVYDFGTQVTLTPNAGAGSTFAGWSGASDCSDGIITVNVDTTCTATFTLNQYTLTVNKAGNGSGTVTSAPAGIDCGSDCSQAYDYGTQVTLNAVAATGYSFTGWSGDAACGSNGVVTVTGDTTCTATFTINAYTLTVSRAGTGSGTVTSNPAGINCGNDCSESYNYNTSVTLTATPATGSTFAGWSGTGCSGGQVTMTVSRTCTATFTINQYTLTVNLAGTGTGTVTSTPAGISCPGDCSQAYVYNTSVTLSAAPASDSIFMGWSGGGCSGTGSCTLLVTTGTIVTATFKNIIACPASFTGWKGEYWDNEAFTGQPTVCRDDLDLNYNWGLDSPDPLIPADHFSARWTRTIYFDSGLYRFYIDHDDGARIYIDGLLVPGNDFWETCCDWDTVDYQLNAGTHSIRLELHEITGAANVQLWWERLSPSVTSITRLDPNPSKLASLRFSVGFSEPVTGVNASDFALTTSGISGAAVTGVSGSGTTYTVTVSTGMGNGTIRLDVVDNDSIKNSDNIPLGGEGMTNGNFTTGQTYTMSKATFGDVPESYWAWNYIERLYSAGITGGCSANPPLYCPEGTVNRAQMAVFLLRGIHGASYSPPAVGNSTGFVDVPANYWAAAWIKQLAAEGITGGCGNGKYCPEYPVTRDQMAVFLLRSEHGAGYTPQAVVGGTGFGDVPSDFWAAAWIKQLVTEGITAGCGSGNYCPGMVVSRAQMAVFLVRTFNLP